MSHTPPLPIPGGIKTVAHWAERPSGNLVIFVHGFRGDAMGTWQIFPTLLTGHKRFRRTDLLFYGYEAKVTAPSKSGALFREFLDRLLSSDLRIVNDSIEQYAPELKRNNKQFQFKKVALVAHSMGAPVVRRALLDKLQTGTRYDTKVELILFAPAHRGAHVARLITELFAGSPLTKAFSSVGKYFVAPYRELQPDSRFISRLIADTEKAIVDGHTYLRAKKVIVGSIDRVVDVDVPFAGDPPPTVIEGAGHFSVCKPSLQVLAPFTEFIK